jgi:hypothetical protein
VGLSVGVRRGPVRTAVNGTVVARPRGRRSYGCECRYQLDHRASPYPATPVSVAGAAGPGQPVIASSPRAWSRPSCWLRSKAHATSHSGSRAWWGAEYRWRRRRDSTSPLLIRLKTVLSDRTIFNGKQIPVEYYCSGRAPIRLPASRAPGASLRVDGVILPELVDGVVLWNLKQDR